MFVSNSYGSNPATSFSGQKGRLEKYGNKGDRSNRKMVNQTTTAAMELDDVLLLDRTKCAKLKLDSETSKLLSDSIKPEEIVQKVVKGIKPLFKR